MASQSSVSAIFQAILQRPAAPGEILNFLSDTFTDLSVAQAIASSPAALGPPATVIRIYEAVFGRKPDVAGLHYWVNRLTSESGFDIDKMAQSFVGSKEYQDRYGETSLDSAAAKPTLIELLYKTALGRTPDAEGLKFWMASNLTPAQLLVHFSEGKEFVDRIAPGVQRFFVDVATSGASDPSGSDADDFRGSIFDTPQTTPRGGDGGTPTPTFSFAIAATDSAKDEGNTGTTAFTFTVTRTGAGTEASSVNWAVTGSGTTPAATSDFGSAFPSGTLSFASKEVTKDITVNVAGDFLKEANEGFTVTLSSPSSNAVIGKATAAGEIQNDDLLPVLLIGSTQVFKGGYTTIKAAVAAAVAGDTILVAAGNYTENLVVAKSITILGTNAGVAGNATTRGTEATLNGNITIASDGITIDGLRFNGGASAIRGQTGKIAYDNLTIRNNLIENTTDSAIKLGLGSGGGIGSDNWIITNNKISDIVGNNRTGMVLFNVTGLTLTGNVIEHDLVTSTGRRGINLDGVRNATVTDNIINMGLVKPTDATAANTASPWAIQVSMSDRVVENVNISGNTAIGANSGIVGLSQRNMINVDITNNNVGDVVSGIVLNTGGLGDGDLPPVASGMTMDVTVTGNTIAAAVNAIFVRDLHDAATNGPVTFNNLDLTGNTINAGIVRIGSLEASQPTADGLLNIMGSAKITGSADNDTVQVEGAGTVTVNSGAGNDTLIGGSGNDTFTGSSGSDLFVFAGGTGIAGLARAGALGVDKITDFTPADDTLQFSEAVFGDLSGAGAPGTLVSAQLTFVSSVNAAATLNTTNGGFVIVGSNTAGSTVQLYYVNSSFISGSTLSGSAGTNANIADITLVGSGFTPVDFVSIA